MCALRTWRGSSFERFQSVVLLLIQLVTSGFSRPKSQPRCGRTSAVSCLLFRSLPIFPLAGCCLRRRPLTQVVNHIRPPEGPPAPAAAERKRDHRPSLPRLSSSFVFAGLLCVPRRLFLQLPLSRLLSGSVSFPHFVAYPPLPSPDSGSAPFTSSAIAALSVSSDYVRVALVAAS